MKHTFKILRILSRHTWWWAAGLVVLLALAVTVARLFLPLLDNYRQQLEHEASVAVGQPVAIGGLKVEWHGLGPRLVLRDVKLLDRSGAQELLGFDRAYIDISVPKSLYQRQFELGDLTLTGVVLSVVRRADGRYALEGVNLPQQDMAEDSSAALKWLLRQPHLVLKDSLVRWRDERSGAHLEFTQVNLRIYNHGDRHQLGGEVVLPDTMGGALTLRMDALGDAEHPEDLQLNFYFKGAQLRLAQWLVDKPVLGMHVVNGSADLELWGLWQKQQLRQVRGVVGLQEFYLARYVDIDGRVDGDVDTGADSATVKLLPSLTGRFVWQGEGSAWQLEMDRLQLGSDWTPTRLHVAHSLRGGERTLEIASNFAHINTLTQLALNSALLPKELHQPLAQWQPRGDLHDVYLKLQLHPEQSPRYFARAQVENLGVNASAKLPGIDGVDLQFRLDQNSGVANLTTVGAHLDTHGLFRELLPLDRLVGQVAWQQQGQGWRVDLPPLTVSNADLEVRLQGRVDLPGADVSPRVDLQAQILRGNGAMTSRYLPVRIMNEETVAWLDRGIVAGQVSDGTLVLQGPLRQFPFVDGSGRFEIGFKVKDGIVDYAAGWPRIEQAVADVAFVGNSMKIRGRSGKVLAANIKHVQVGIADFSADPVRLLINGEVAGSTGDLLQFMNESPLEQQFGKLTNGSEASGKSMLGLKLDIPLTGAANITTHGWVSFDNSTLNLKRLGIDLAAINGRMEFSDHSLDAKNIAAEVLGQPAQLTISTSTQPRSKGNITFTAAGESRLVALEKRIDLPVFGYLKGESPWQAQLEIPYAKGVSPTLRVVSRLETTAVELPVGLGKPANGARAMELRGEFGEQATLWRFDYDKARLNGIFEQLHDDQGSRLNRAELRFGQMAQLPPTPGFRIAGFMDSFDYAAWRPILFPVETQTSGPRDGKKAPEPIKVTEVDVGFNRASLLGQSLRRVKLQAQRSSAAWSAQIESQELAGKVVLPDDWKNPLKIELARLYIMQDEPSAAKKAEPDPDPNPLPSTAQAAVDPRQLPPLHITSSDTRYGKALLGSMKLVTSRRPEGMSVDSLRLDSATANISLRGSWVHSGDGQQRSQLGGTLDIHDLGNLLAGFGYVEAVKNGKGSSVVDLKWKGSLLEPAVARLEGPVSFDLKDGRLLEVEPGAGRLFGLLSVQALPRRLTLDFSDFFGKGLAFDSMRGRFDFKDGNAVTNDFALDGPSARVELQGRVGLVARDYDQQLKVMPHLTSGLPLAGAVIAGVGVGAAVLLIERLLKSNIDRATGIRYHVTGSWDAPVMARQE